MNLKTVTKRSGLTVDYDRQKIYNAIAAASNDSPEQMKEEEVRAVTLQVERNLSERDNATVEEIQDVVEHEIMRHGFFDIAKKYIRYRQRHEERRAAQKHLMECYRDIFFADAVDSDLKRDNANINTDASMGIMLKLGAEGAKHFVDNYVLPEAYAAADQHNYIHIHDKDFSLITFNCLTGDTKIVFRNVLGKVFHTDFHYFDPFFEKFQKQVIDVRHCGFQTVSRNGFQPIHKLMRRHHEGKIYKIRLQNGVQLKATAEHLLTVRDSDGREVTKEVRALQIGDEIPAAEYPLDAMPERHELNLIDLFDSRERDVVIANSDVVRKSVPAESKTYFYEVLRRNRTCKTTEALYNKNLTLQEYKCVRDLVELDEHDLELSCVGGRSSVPAVLVLDEKLGKIVGYVLSEGFIDEKGSCIVFSNQDRVLVNEFKDCVSSHFPKMNVQEYVRGKNGNTAKCDLVRVFGKILVKLFRGVLAYKKNSHEICMPKWFFESNAGFLSGFFSAEVDGDGSVDGLYQAKIATVAPKLAEQLQYVLSLHNISSCLRKIKSKGEVARFADGTAAMRRYDTYTVTVTGKDFDDFRGLACSSYKLGALDPRPVRRKSKHDGRVVDISLEDFKGYVYDFETEDHHFAANGMLSHNCCQIDLLKLFHGGFSTGHGFLREPNSIRAYASLACIAIQSNQNDMFGGQSINCFDYAMAEGVRKSFRKAVMDEAFKAMFYRFGGEELSDRKAFRQKFEQAVSMEDCNFTEKDDDPVRQKSIEAIRTALDDMLKSCGKPVSADREDARSIYLLACQDVAEETHQAMEALIHNFNTLHSRAGAQVPFSSINYGMDTSPEGRLATREVMNAIMAGLGNGETPIFPISVFQLKAGVNYNPGDPNYDLFLRACEVSAKRLFPNFVNLDAPYNLQYYKPGDYNSYVATMGCRTRVMSNVNGPEESGSRGNFSFVTINLPKLALEAKGNLEEFWQIFDRYIKLSHDYLLFRLQTIAEKHVYNYPFLMGQGVWMDSDKLKATDKIRGVLKHASFSIGFCGLAECLVALVGKHHGESGEAQELGLRIVGHLREVLDGYTKEEHMNWTCFGTPAESTAGQFQRANRKVYGMIPGVTDRDYMTNSSHVPVYYPIKAIDKIRIEAPYHALCNAGHIAYVEMDGDPSQNIQAFETIVRAMHDHDMGYFSINHPVDRDPVCGYTGIIANECPHCHRKEIESGTFVVPRMK